MAKFNLTATVNTSLAGTTLAGEQGFTVGVLNGVGATGPQGLTGAGFTGGSYDSSTGIVTFTSDDGLGFSTGDLRGADGTGTGSVTSVGTGGGLTGGPITSSGTISHADTSTQSDITATSNTYVDGLTFDDYGHVTGVTTVAGFDGDYNNLTNQPTLGTAAAAATTDFATAAQGATADTALQPNAAADFGSNEIKYSNVYATTGDLPNASTYHGMFAHVHATGKGYFAHAGNWVELANASHTHAISEVTNLQTELNGKVDTSSVGIANGVAELDSNGLVPTSQLPSYVDDVLEYANFSSFPTTGEAGKIYVDLATNDIYRWSGSAYVQVNDAVSTADQATQLATARTIELTGDVTGSTTFDGSANVQISTTSASGGGGFPSETKMLFQQSAAPTGWTKDTTHNNKALRVVSSGTVSSGGNVAFTTAFSASRTVSGSVAGHTLILSEIPSHNHGSGTLEVASHTHPFSGGSYNVSRFDGDFGGDRSNNVDREAPNESDFTQFTITVPNSTGGSGDLAVSGSTADEGGGGSHNHGWSGSVNLDVQYVDLIIATKD
jgi:hypothetical protein